MGGADRAATEGTVTGITKRADRRMAAMRIWTGVRPVAALFCTWVRVDFMVVVTCLSGGTDVYFHADMDGEHTVVPPIGTACASNVAGEGVPAPA